MLDEQKQIFLQVKLKNLSNRTSNFTNELSKMNLQLEECQLINPRLNNEFNNIMEPSQTNQKGFSITRISYSVPGLTTDTVWQGYDKFEGKFPPLIIRLTEDIYDHFYNYFFKSD
jgi:hypothetical protein